MRVRNVYLDDLLKKSHNVLSFLNKHIDRKNISSANQVYLKLHIKRFLNNFTENCMNLRALNYFVKRPKNKNCKNKNSIGHGSWIWKKCRQKFRDIVQH